MTHVSAGLFVVVVHKLMQVLVCISLKRTQHGSSYRNSQEVGCHVQNTLVETSDVDLPVDVMKQQPTSENR